MFRRFFEKLWNVRIEGWEHGNWGGERTVYYVARTFFGRKQYAFLDGEWNSPIRWYKKRSDVLHSETVNDARRHYDRRFMKNPEEQPSDIIPIYED